MRWPQVSTSPAAVSTTVCRLAAATATTRLPYALQPSQRSMHLEDLGWDVKHLQVRLA